MTYKKQITIHYIGNNVSFSPAWAALLMLALILSSSAGAQTLFPKENSSRVKIGLALSGGGARGAAHLGILRVLEENRVPIDYIAGTSMGAIVGGLYSSGLNTYEIEAALKDMDWDTIFDDSSARIERSFRRKRDDDLYLIKYKPGLNQGKLKFSRGLVQGQKIELELSRQLLPVDSIDNFDQLTIPFRAVATDIATGEAIILKSGNLAQSIRASMSIPTIISPAYIDERYLVDGGVSNNLPIDVVKEMGADVVIAIDFGTPLSSQEEIDSAIAITQQLTGFLTHRGSRKQIDLLSDKDLLITPELGSVTTGDFSKIPLAIAAGVEAAKANSDALLTLALSPSSYERYRNALSSVDKKLPVIDSISIVNNSTVSNSIIRNRFVETEINQPLDVKALERDIAGLYGLGLFENIYYEIKNENAQNILSIVINERSWGPSYLQFGLQYNSNGGGENTFNFGLSYLATGLNSRAGEWRSALQFGSEPSAASEIYQPFGARGEFFISSQVGYSERIVNVSQSSSSVASLNLNEIFAEIGVGRELSTWGELRGGVRFSNTDVDNRIGDVSITQDPLNGGNVFLRFSTDEFDNIHFPKKGSRVSFEWLGSRKSLGADATFDQIKITTAFAKTHKNNTFILNGFFDITSKGTASLQNNFSLGGFGQLSGFLANEFRGQHRAFGLVGLYRPLFKSNIASLYGGVTAEYGVVTDARSELSFDEGNSAGSLWLGADTVLGPIYVAYGLGEHGASAWYLFIGNPF